MAVRVNVNIQNDSPFPALTACFFRVKTTKYGA